MSENNYQVYVINKNGKPLMPTKRFGKVRRLLNSGRARVVKRKPFTIQLLYDTKEHIQPLILGIDPGYKHIGAVVRKENGEIVYASELTTRTEEVTINMTERKMHRRARRNHKRLKRKRRAKRTRSVFKTKEFAITGMEKAITVKGIKPELIRFQHRKRDEGWLNPTLNHLLQTHKNFVAMIGKILPVQEVRVEYGKFDIHKIEKPEISGNEYQEGRMKGYTNAQEYVLCRDGHTCQYCKKNNVLLQVHHVIERSENGQDVPENMITLCKDCHDKIHKDAQAKERLGEIFQGIEKRYTPTSVLNSIMPSFTEWLETRFVRVSKTYGYETKEKRRELNLEKEHYIDAYLISFASNPVAKDFRKVLVYQFQQFRRHNRQLIHATRDRNYEKSDKDSTKTSLFTVSNFKKPVKKLVAKLRDATQDSDPVSLYLKRKLSKNFQKQIKAYKDGEVLSKDFLDTLAGELNHLLENPLYQEKIFAKVELSKKTKTILASKGTKNLTGEELRKLNRVLLENAYPHEIAKSSKIVAKNRNKRTGQLEDSLAEVRERNGTKFLRCLKVFPGMKMIIRKKFNKFKRGDIVQYKGYPRVVKGFGSLGRTIGFVGHKEYIPARRVHRILKNSGIVCT